MIYGWKDFLHKISEFTLYFGNGFWKVILLAPPNWKLASRYEKFLNVIIDLCFPSEIQTAIFEPNVNP